jgi:hypothetical protein
VDKEAALRSVYQLAKPWLKQGFRFGGLHRYVDAGGAEVYAMLRLLRAQTGDVEVMHLEPAENGYELRDGRRMRCLPTSWPRSPPAPGRLCSWSRTSRPRTPSAPEAFPRLREPAEPIGRPKAAS